ncbi:MAG: molecular chaperone TorD family protein [Betaproteobacteria bacterium]
MNASTVVLHWPIAPEDDARAGFYALLSRLFAAPPDASLLEAIGTADKWEDDGANPMAAAWNRLVLASGAMDVDAAAQEYTDLFVGVGKCAVNPHGSHWISGFMMEKPLAELRTTLARLGLAREPGVTMLEDHLAALFETMRILITGMGERSPAPATVQCEFFTRHIEPWVFDCCGAMVQCEIANYYRRVAKFVTLFLAVERDSLAMD